MEALKREVEHDSEAYQYEQVECLGVSRGGSGSACKRLGIRQKNHRSHFPKPLLTNGNVC